MSWWKRDKCKTCERKFKKKDVRHTIRIDSLDGVSELEICEDCAEFFDASAEFLQRKDNTDGE